MTTRQTPPKWLEIDKFVEAYEAAHALNSDADLTEHLPDPDHPFYVAVLGELVRVDLEFAWVRGQPWSLDRYIALFPCLADDREALQQIAFEHYRQRCEHGEAPSPEEYDHRFDVDTDDWPSPAATARSHAPAPKPKPKPRGNFDGLKTPAQRDEQEQVSGPLHEASLVYGRFRLGPGRDDPEAFQSLGTSLQLSESVIELFRDLHASDPNVAWRLAQAAIALPCVGEVFLDFRLIAELGRGAFGRVYLARQTSLADRLVVLKISTDLMNESEMLAQLQHTNIVPIYSVHHASPLQAVCMPYFGATTLADVLKELRGLSSPPTSGRHFLSTIHARQSSTVVEPPVSLRGKTEGLKTDGPRAAAGSASALVPLAPDTLDKLEKSTHIDAVLWLGARLAEGLAHAHARGIRHHDLKPANILLADDGQPMLLDFNLAEDAKLRSKAAAARVGGTLPYMSTEQLEAFLGGARPIDGRTDIYSLGLILFELLTGRPPFTTPSGPLSEVLTAMIAERRGPAPQASRINRAVSPAVDSIVRRCLEPEPAARYQSAADLREDLERQLAHQELKFAKEPSPRERMRKWRRRHPRLASAASVAAIAVLLLGALTTSVGYLKLQVARHHARERMAGFLDEKREAEVLISVRGDERDPVREFMDQARRLLDGYQVRTNPRWMDQPVLRDLDPQSRDQLREEIGYLAFFLARAESLQADRESNLSGRRERFEAALRLNDLAQTCFDDERRPQAIRRQRDDLTRMRDPTIPRDDRAPSPSTVGTETARETYLLASDLLAQGKCEESLPLAQRAVKADPQLFAAQFLLGNALLYAGQDRRAESVYGTCVALWPDCHWPYFNRAIVRHRLMMYELAREDLDRVIELKPGFVDAYVERAQVRRQQKDYRGAIADLDHALKHGASPTNIHFLRARTHALANNSSAANQDLEAGMRVTPTNEQGWVARGLARLPNDPKAAIADFDKAIELNPRSRPARQNKAHVLSEFLNKGSESVAVLNSVLCDFPDYLPSLGGRGILLARLGERKPAHADAEACLRLSQRGETLYQTAGIYALTSRETADDRVKALRLLAAAFADQGYGLDLVDQDADLDPIRSQPEFRRLVAAARLLHHTAAER